MCPQYLSNPEVGFIFLITCSASWLMFNSSFRVSQISLDVTLRSKMVQMIACCFYELFVSGILTFFGNTVVYQVPKNNCINIKIQYYYISYIIIKQYYLLLRI